MKEKKRIPVSFRIKKELHDSIESLVAANDKLTRSAVVEMALSNYFLDIQRECLIQAHQEKILIPLRFLHSVIDEDKLQHEQIKIFTMGDREYVALSLDQLLQLLLCHQLQNIKEITDKKDE